MVFLPPLPEVRCQIFLEIRNPWGKVMKRSGLTFEHFCLEMVENCRAKKSFFFADFAGYNRLIPLICGLSALSHSKSCPGYNRLIPI